MLFFSSGSTPAAFQVLLKMTDIEKYYPQKLTLTDAVCICHETLGNLQYTEKPELLPYFILKKIMMCNYECRTNILHTRTNISTDSHEESDSNLKGDQVTNYVHPQDGLLALLHCADSFLRQNLMAKLSICKTAIPFLLPDPIAQTLTFPLWSMRSIVKKWQSKVGDKECCIVDCKTPIVSFLRFSKAEISKSKMLNDVIGDSEHDFFFHWDCREVVLYAYLWMVSLSCVGICQLVEKAIIFQILLHSQIFMVMLETIINKPNS